MTYLFKLARRTACHRVLPLIALTAAGEEIPDAALEPLRAAQGNDGGWAFDGSTTAGAADSNTTALVIQALVAAGHGDDPMVDRGLAFLSTLLVPDDGFAYGPADPLVAAVDALAALGREQRDDVVAGLDSLVEDNDHFEFYWFPHTDRLLTKRNNRTLDEAEPLLDVGHQRLLVGLPVVVEVVLGHGLVIGHSNLRASMGRNEAARAAG